MTRRILYGSAALGVVLLFFLLLWEPMRSAVAESDLAWMIPVVFHAGEGKPLGELIRLIFSSGPYRVVFPFMKANLLLLSELGLHTRHLVLIGLILQVVNAALVYALSRLLAFPRRVGFFAALVYLTLFADFHAYLWPTAMSYHLYPLFLTLVTLCLFFRTERALEAGERWRRFLYALMLMLGVVCSIGRGSVLALLLIFLDILFGSRSGRERELRYARWLPLFLLSAAHPLHTLMTSGEWHSNALIRAWMEGAGRGGLPYPLKLVGLFALWALFLLGVRGALRVLESRVPHRVQSILWLAAAGAILLLLIGFDRRQILFLYNGLAPLATLLSTFLQPIRSAMGLDSSHPFYLFQPQTEVSLLLLSAGLLLHFVWAQTRGNPHRRMVIGWYVISLVHFLFQFSSQPVVAQSRHLIHIAPAFALLLVCAVESLFRILGERLRLSGVKRDGVLLLFFLALCLPNLLAVRLAVWRGKLANNFYTYDDIRTAHLIREKLQAEGRGVGEDEIVVQGVVPMPYDGSFWRFPEVNPKEHRMFRFVMEEVLGDRSLGRRIRVLPEGVGDGAVRDPFQEMADQTGALIVSGDLPAARELLLKAIRRRPFLLRYLLPPTCRSSDVRWMTQGQGMLEWVQRTAQWWTKPGRVIEKQRHIQRVLEEEILTYAKAFFYLSYVQNEEGSVEQSRYWLSQIWYLEPDPDRAIPWLLQAEEIRSNRALSEFTRRFRDPAYFDDPLPWRKDDFGLERFLMRFLIGLDVRSSWDRQQDVIK